MRACILVLILAVCMTSCSLSTLEGIAGLTDSLKENIYVNTGLVDVDTAPLIRDIEAQVLSPETLLVSSGFIVLPSCELNLSPLDPVSPVLAPADRTLLQELALAGENKVKRQAVSRFLRQEAGEEACLAAGNTAAFFSDLVDYLGPDHKLVPVLSRFCRESEDFTLADILSFQVSVSLLSTALSYFEEDTSVTLEEVRDALEQSAEEIEPSYIDAVALALGQGKSVARCIGSDWLFGALDGVLDYVRRSL